MGQTWDLADLAASGDLATEYGVSPSAISNWITRLPEFPRPLVELSTGPVYSRRQVRAWHDRQWPTFRKGQRRQ